jgi:hypothetical protein
MPPLRTKNIINQPTTAVTDEEKSDVLFDAFFAKPGNSPPPDPNAKYPAPKFQFRPFTQSQVRQAIRKLKPYAAPGEDGISNLILQRCEELLLPLLTVLFQASFDLKHMPERWKDTRTLAYRTPGKPDYTVAKAYRPVEVAATIRRLFGAVVASDILVESERAGILPPTQFGSRPV